MADFGSLASTSASMTSTLILQSKRDRKRRSTSCMHDAGDQIAWEPHILEVQLLVNN